MVDINDNSINDTEISDTEELDAPIFIFPDENPSDDPDETSPAGSDEQADEDNISFSARLFASEKKENEDDSAHLTFGRVHATKKEKEFVYMPFLNDDPVDDEDEDDGEVSSLTFGRVHAAKKEKEFIFMPFLNISDDAPENETDAEQKSYVVRPDGTVFDEGMILQPLSPLDNDDEDEEDSAAAEYEEEHEDDLDDIGIYVTDASPEDLTRRPAKTPSSQKRPSSHKSSTKKRPPSPPSRQGSPKKSKGKPSNSLPTADEQFRAAMMNINPEIRRAAMRDPIQRAALEQAIRIALVQQAAQEAVARTTGSPGGYGNNGYEMNTGQPPRSKKNKKKRPPQTSAQQSASRAPARSTNVRGFSLGSFTSTPADFGTVTPPTAPPVSPIANAAAGANDYMGQNESFEYNPAGTPDAAQDPTLAALAQNSTAAAHTAPSEQQDPALASLASSGQSAPSGQRTITSYSPAAIRAAMRAGIDLTLPQTAAAAASATQSSAAAQKSRLMDSVNTRRSGCLIWIIVLFILFFIGLLGIAVWPSLSNEIKYQDASALMAAGSYIEASEQFAALNDYKDSESKSCEAIYVYALALQNAGDYESAIEYYSTITNYSTTSERIAECRYILGKQYMSVGDYESAYDQLYLIPRYNDAGDLAKESNYQCAMQLYNEGSYASALVRFGMYPDYLDSYNYWQICQYENASALLVSGDYAGAYDQFAELADYDDAPFKTALSQYYLVLNGLRSFTLEQLRSSLEIIESYDTSFAREVLESSIYTAAKLEGSWYDENGISYIIYNGSIDSPTLTMCLAPEDEVGTEIVVSAVIFDNDLAYYMHGEMQTMLIRVEQFEPESAASPATVVIYDYSSNTTYTLYRNGQR